MLCVLFCCCWFGLVIAVIAVVAVVVIVGPRHITLEFGQNWVGNS